MVNKIGDLVQQITTGTGSGNLILTPVSGKRTFALQFSTGVTTNVFYYFISHQTLPEWEIGIGHVSDASTLVRDTVSSSSNSNAKVVFSPGTKDVVNDLPASQQAFIDSSSVNGQLLYNSTGVMGGVPGSSVNSSSGNIDLSGDINFQNANNINGLGSLNFSGNGANEIINVTDIFFDGNGGGIHDFGDSTMIPGGVFDVNGGIITGAAQIGTVFNSLDDGTGNAFISGQISSGSVSTGVINASAISGTTVSTSGDIASSGGNIAGGYRMNSVAQGANYIAIPSDSLITMDATTGARTITLPIIGTAGAGKMYWVIKSDSSANAVTLTRSSSNTINGGTSYAITQQNQYVFLVAVGSNWQIISTGFGSQQSTILTSVSLTNQGADIGSTNFANANVAGLYRVNYSLQDTTADLTAGAVTLTISYTDGAGATTTTATQVLTGTGRTSGTVFVQLASGSISYSTSHTGIFGSAKYALYMTAERLL